MASITSTGVGSGLDIESLVTQLVSAESTPAKKRLASEEVSLTAELSAFGSLKGALSSLQSAFSDLNRVATFNQRSSSSSDKDSVTINANNSAVAGTYRVAVDQMASAHSLASGSYATSDTVVGEGTLTLRFGETDFSGGTYNSFSLNGERDSVSIAINSSNNTLAGVRDAINASDAGVTATIVNDGSGYRLLVSSDQTGAKNSIEISVTDTDGNDADVAGLSALAFNASASHMSQTIEAADAQFTVNGLAVSSASNSVNNVVDGVNLELKNVTAQPVTLSVTENKEAVKDALNKFIGGYNAFAKQIDGLTGYDPDTKIAGALQGDFSTRTIVSQVQNLLTREISGVSSGFSTLAEIGITTKVDGTLEMDSSRIDKVLENDFDRLAGMFAAAGFPSDSDITFVQAGKKVVAGDYAVNISQIATQGVYAGTVITFPLTIDGSNDSLSLKINNTSSNNIQITHGSYASGSELASELQSRINGDEKLKAANIRVNVAFADNKLSITSSIYGSGSKVEIESVDTNTLATLGLNVGAGVGGVDVAGTIGGVDAVGSGQLLRGGVGTAVDGVQLVIEGSATGHRGSVQFSRGITDQLKTLIGGFLDNEGILSARTDSIESAVEEIGVEREALDRRMAILEARYRSQFTVLDTLMAQLNSTSSFLTQQIDALPKPNSVRS